MTSPTRKYRLKDDPTKVYTAVRYGNDNRGWSEDLMPQVAKFVLGIDIESRVSLTNERLLDVVQPVSKTWNPANWVADIVVADWSRGQRYEMRLGDWLLKDEQAILTKVDPITFEEHFELVPVEEQEYTEFNELADVIYDAMPWEGETYQAFAENVAGQILRKGWSKK